MSSPAIAHRARVGRAVPRGSDLSELRLGIFFASQSKDRPKQIQQKVNNLSEMFVSRYFLTFPSSLYGQRPDRKGSLTFDRRAAAKRVRGDVILV